MIRMTENTLHDGNCYVFTNDPKYPSAWRSHAKHSVSECFSAGFPSVAAVSLHVLSLLLCHSRSYACCRHLIHVQNHVTSRSVHADMGCSTLYSGTMFCVKYVLFCAEQTLREGADVSVWSAVVCALRPCMPPPTPATCSPPGALATHGPGLQEKFLLQA